MIYCANGKVTDMKIRNIKGLAALTMSAVLISGCGGAGSDPQVDQNPVQESVSGNDYSYDEKSSYMIYYGELNQDIINEAKQYEIVILHPRTGNITRDQVQEIRSSGTIVLGYVTIGEDLRTSWMTPEQMLQDERFIGNGEGPRVDPRPAGQTTFDDVDVMGNPSDGGTGYASYYLDDNDHDGKPDFNPYFACAYVNMGDPNWYEVVDKMTMDGAEQIPGLREVLTDDYGRGLGCDGVFLDTIDTCAPNSYTSDDQENKTRFEWTAPGVAEFTRRIKEEYPDKLILQNRGIFFYNSNLPHYKYSPRQYVDYVMFESFRLDSNPGAAWNENFYADNRYIYAPKLIAEASRPDGFQILSLGYAEGPEEMQLKETLLENSTVGMDVLMEDINVAESMGFMHYITDGYVTMTNDFVIHHEDKADNEAPVWSSVYNDSPTWPPHEPAPRVGIGEVEPVEDGVTVRWDVALDENPVTYVLYYQTEAFDFESDPGLENAESLELVPEIGRGYENGVGPGIFPFETTISGLESGTEYYFVIRARDNTAAQNEDDNTVVMTGKPY